MISNGISKLDLKRRNRMQILRLLRRNGPTSRIDIAREIGITKAAVTIITNEMIQHGILYEKGEQRNPDVRATRGRKKILLDICSTYKMDLGMVLEGQTLYAGVSTLWGDVVEKQSVAVAPGVSREELLIQMEELYRQLLYKNDLKPEQITGLGICISKRYFQTLQIKDGATPDYRNFAEYLHKFVQVPVTFGSLVEGAALAEQDYWQHKTTPADEMVLIHCGEQMEGAVIIAQELYRGASGRAMRLPQEANSEAEQQAWKRIQELYSEEKTPDLWRLTEGNINRVPPVLRAGRLAECDQPVQAVMEQMIEARTQKLKLVANYFDPAKILLMAAHPDEVWFAETLYKQLQKELPDYKIGMSMLSEQTLFLAGAALATREFFCNRGGY